MLRRRLVCEGREWRATATAAGAVRGDGRGGAEEVWEAEEGGEGAGVERWVCEGRRRWGGTYAADEVVGVAATSTSMGVARIRGWGPGEGATVARGEEEGGEEGGPCAGGPMTS